MSDSEFSDLSDEEFAVPSSAIQKTNKRLSKAKQEALKKARNKLKEKRENKNKIKNELLMEDEINKRVQMELKKRGNVSFNIDEPTKEEIEEEKQQQQLNDWSEREVVRMVKKGAKPKKLFVIDPALIEELATGYISPEEEKPKTKRGRPKKDTKSVSKKATGRGRPKKVAPEPEPEPEYVPQPRIDPRLAFIMNGIM